MTVKETIARYSFDELVPYLKPIIYKPRRDLPVLRKWYTWLQALEPAHVQGLRCHAMWCNDNLVHGKPREYFYVTGVEGGFWRDILASEFSWDPQATEPEALAWLLNYLTADTEPFDSIENHPESYDTTGPVPKPRI